MKRGILNIAFVAIVLFMTSGCVVDRCPANNGGYIELKMPKKTTNTDNLVLVRQASDNNAKN